MRSFWNLMMCGGCSQASAFVSYHDMACHTWALSGNQRSAKRTHERYMEQMDNFGRHFDYGYNLRGHTLVHVRQWCIDSLRGLCDQRARLTGNRVYLCGGFREGQVCPEHLWLEDHTAQRTYDTFIETPIMIISRVGNQNASFQPGCEADDFAANQIARIQVNGFTIGQLESIQRHSEMA